MTATTHVRARRTTIPRWTLIAAVPLAAVAIAYVATRRPIEPAVTADHSRHGQGFGGDVAKPVMLTADQERRIGITYAVASVTPLAREIRTVGQVTYDETRVKAVSLRVDGWVEELYVNFTGQPVAAGAGLLSIHSPMLITAQEELLLARRLVADVRDADSTARASAASLLNSARRRLAYWDVSAADIQRLEESGDVQRTLVLRSPVHG
ncbi:MAG: efflux RND transporter periplasmic adaptor subunit, partial [Gemmatimonadaceae bacterium]